VKKGRAQKAFRVSEEGVAQLGLPVRYVRLGGLRAQAVLQPWVLPLFPPLTVHEHVK